MEKIKLQDGTELAILGGATSSSVAVMFEEMADLEIYRNSMTEDNLSKVEVLNSSGLVCATLSNKYLSQIKINTKSNVATFVLADVDMIEKRLEALEQTQELQDSAIVELAEMTAGEVEEPEGIAEETTDTVIAEEGELNG